MTQTNAIILRFREEEAENFEALFRKEVLPLWRQFKDRGKIISASLTPVEDGNQGKKGVRDYILHVEVPSMAEHSDYLEAVGQIQTEGGKLVEDVNSKLIPEIELEFPA